MQQDKYVFSSDRTPPCHLRKAMVLIHKKAGQESQKGLGAKMDCLTD